MRFPPVTLILLLIKTQLSSGHKTDKPQIKVGIKQTASLSPLANIFCSTYIFSIISPSSNVHLRQTVILLPPSYLIQYLNMYASL